MKKIGIVTFNNVYNFGAFLQEYALQTFLLDNQFDAKVINYSNFKFDQLYLYSNNVVKIKGAVGKLKIIYNILFRPKTYIDRVMRNSKFKKAIANEIHLTSEFKDFDKRALNNAFDYFIAGSDQVWNIQITNRDMYYFLDFVSDCNKKISYAASFGRSTFEQNDLNQIKKYLMMFSKLLVRELSGKKILEKMGLQSEIVLDPTLLIKKEQWVLFSNKSTIRMPSKYVVIYIVATPTYLIDAAVEYAKKNDCKTVFIIDKNKNIVHNGKKIHATINVGPYDFVKYILNADKVFTTSFHGMAMAINLNIDFYYELNNNINNNNSRLENLARILCLENRQIIGNCLTDNKIDWNNVNALLQLERNKSQQLLLESLNKEVIT